ncbi:MAG: hypothetical protein IPK73_11715 [Candidatus Obscuribacter sp.]|nr:hypothetical protein [Candidatus Obscuribacter sp.]MBK9281686.1 hypothetical protein [Candidatus Obscuribacter sp.]
MNTEKTLVTKEELFRAKESRRHELANKSAEEKFLLLLKLQKMTSEIARQAGRTCQQPWRIDVLRQSDANEPKL